jgi:MtN3 and saliva related transmembrane protein
MAFPLDTPTLVGFVAAVCTTGAFVPQVVRVWRLKSAGEISLTTFSVFAFGTFVWLIYGWLIGSVPVILANAVTLVLALTIVLLKLNYDRAGPGSSAESPPGRGR